MKHTPGKWLAVWGKNGLTINIATIGHPKTIAQITCEDFTDSKTVSVAEANARLIAAAPGMLEELKDWTHRIDCECDNTHENNNTVCAHCHTFNLIKRIEGVK